MRIHIATRDINRGQVEKFVPKKWRGNKNMAMSFNINVKLSLKTVSFDGYGFECSN